METIIALLFILLPLIFKLIGKKFEQAGQPHRAEQMREFAELFGSDDDETEVRHDDDGQVVDVPPVTVTPVHTYVRPVVHPTPAVTENVVRQTASKKKPVTKKPILEEDVQVRKGEKIDPKKLVIYSEIMKPKYTE